MFSIVQTSISLMTISLTHKLLSYYLTNSPTHQLSMKDEFFYRKLNVYQKAVDLVAGIYKLLKIFPPEERYALCDQIRRASVSVASNIAEGMSRVSDKEKNHFLEISTGSLMETMCQIEIAKRLEYVSKEDFDRVEKEIYEIACMLSSLRKKINQTNSLTH